jgi:leader peptidase (prepilin peptidase)/N-methyltransferase
MDPATIIARAGLTLFAWWGLAAGSFANVLIYRLPAGFRLTLPRRSVCTGCFRRLAWYENIPLLSYLVLRGRCKGCKSPIGLRHPVVELLVASLFIAVHARWGFTVEAGGRAVFCMLLVAATFIDLEHRIIPDEISLGGLALGLLLGVVDHEVTFLSRILGAAAGAGGFWLIAWLYAKATGRDGLGFGDVKLLGTIGAFLGPAGVFGTVMVSSVTGAVVGLALIGFRRGSLRTAVPYGPFLVLGALLMLFWGDGLMSWLYPGLSYGTDV